MSLELALAANTAALEKLSAILSNTAKPTTPAKAEKSAEPVKAEKPAEVARAEPAAATPDYKTVAAAVLDLQKAKGTAIAKGVIQSFDNATHLQAIDKAQYPAVLQAVEQAMAA